MSLLRDIVRFHKLKLLLIFVLFALFFVLLFPYGDLGNLLTSKIYDASGQQVFVQTKNLDLTLLPVPGVKASDVNVEPGQRGARFQPLRFDELRIRPLLSALLAFRAGASVEGSGLFGGEAAVSLRTVSSIFSLAPGPIEITQLEFSDVSLTALLSYLMGPASELKVGGKLSAASTGIRFDPTQKEPMSGDLALNIEGLVIPKEIPIPNFGAMEIADSPLKIQKTEFRTQISNNKLRITQGSFGNAQEPISGRLLGEVDLLPVPGGVRTGQFNICIEVSLNQGFYDSLAKRLGSAIQLLNSAVDRFRRPEAGVKYGIRATGNDFSNVPMWQTSPGDCKTFAGAP